MIEKIKLMNVVGNLNYINNAILDILKSKSVNLINAKTDLEIDAFSVDLNNDENLQRNIELNYISSFDKDKEKYEDVEHAKELLKFFDIEKLDDKYFEEVDLDLNFDKFYQDLKEKINKLKEVNEKLSKLENIEKNYELFSNINVDLTELSRLEYFDVKFGILDKAGRYRIKKNYSNLLSVIFHVSSSGDDEIYMAIYPKDAANSMETILKSVNFREVDILKGGSGTLKETIENFEKEKKFLQDKKANILEYRDNLIKNDSEIIKKILARTLVEENIENVKKYMLRSKNYFYLSAYIGVSDIDDMKERLSKYKGLKVEFLDPKDLNLKPPTKLKNNFFFRPFEQLVQMYGIPSYDEVDPTVFFGISYMLLFGSMFGDLGQGLVFILLGFYLAKNKNKDFGELLKRMGLASSFFGLMYGSVFGNEKLLPAIWIRPFETIDQTLVYAIGFGLVLLVFSYIIGFINKIRIKEYEEALFSKEGLAGFVVFISMLDLGLNFMGGNGFLPNKIATIAMLMALLLMIFKRPIYQLLSGQKVAYEDSDATGYYIQGAFSLLEALLTILSNIISFIRVGAFAINHVGLFLAFKTVGQMTGSGFWNIVALIIGNIVIISLEGLIVFIQSLRLEYYEMFSKYFLGEGYEFKTEKIVLEEN
ncbi:V-type ATP synthase subunit I [Peptoniphilus obesi]|uniref:V-type ATP synthase subunit I n=1 Tax=Peptoniphilus obesi TaxID=1472765 RepID=UPI0004AD3329|nr:V-type ATPase 116kDa subunit family protein [Peptoniphilus obesi]